MNGKVPLPLGFAVWIVLATVGVLSIFSLTAYQPTIASIPNTGGLTSAQVDPEKLTPIVMATSVGTGTATVFPDRPGDPSRLRVDFPTSSSGRLDPVDEIIITVEDDFGFVIEIPMVLNLITVSFSSVSTNTGDCLGDAGYVAADHFPNETVNPSGVDIDFTGDENDLAHMTVTVPV